MRSRPQAPVMPAYRQPSGLESENRRLRDELFLVRDSLIHLMDPLDLLRGYLGIENDDQLDNWLLPSSTTTSAIRTKH